MITNSATAVPPALDALRAPNSGLVNKGTEQRDQYLFLLTTQLKNQDPLNPQKPEELTAQLATFSQLEALLNLSSEMEGQSALLAQNVLASQNTLALGAVGRTGTFAVETLNQDFATGDRLDVILPSGGEATLIITGADGQESRLALGSLSGGRQTITVPGGLTAGAGKASIEVVGPDGTTRPGAMVTRARIEGVRFTADGTLFRVNGEDVMLAALLELESDAAPAPASTTSL